MSDTRTFTADQIKDLVMEYHEGCPEQKVAFLEEQFGITVEHDQTGTTYDVTVKLSFTLADPKGFNEDQMGTDPYDAIDTFVLEQEIEQRLAETLDEIQGFADCAIDRIDARQT